MEDFSASPREKHNDIQWTKSKSHSDDSWLQNHLLEVYLCSVLLLSCAFEYLFSCGFSALLLLSLALAVYSSGLSAHDNIPSLSLYYPIIGHIPWILRYFNGFYAQECQEFLDHSKNKCNGAPVPLMAFASPGRTQVLIADPVLVDIVFRQKFADATKADASYEPIRPLLGNGIFATNGKVWKKHRAIASRMFTTRSLRDFMFCNFVETADKLVLKCGSMMETCGADGVNMYDMFLRMTFEAFTNTAFGVEVNAIDAAPKVVPFAKAFDESLELIGQRYLSPRMVWKLMQWLDVGPEKTLRKHVELMDAFVDDVICKRKEYYANLRHAGKNEDTVARDASNGTNYRQELRQRYDLLSMFIKDNPDINDTELRDVTMNFIIAGRDTTAQMLGWFMYEMTRCDERGQKVNEAIEKKIREEIKQVLKKHAESGGSELTYALMSDFKYLEAAFLETLRLHPSVPHLVRTAVSEYNFGEITGDYGKYNYTIRKGDEVWVTAWTMGRLPWIWKDPLEFRPNRFLDQKKW